MAPQQASRAQSGSSRTPHHLAEPNLQGETRVHRRYFNGLLGNYVVLMRRLFFSGNVKTFCTLMAMSRVKKGSMLPVDNG